MSNKLAIYDSPFTHRREGYLDGLVVWFVDRELIEMHPDHFGRINGKKIAWEKGRIFGDPSAMQDPLETYGAHP